MSRIISSNTTMLETETDEDVCDLIQLIDELNQSTDLTVKFKTNSKIIKYLTEASKDLSTDKAKIYQSKASRDLVSKAVGDIGKLNFGSKSKLQEAQAAGIFFDPKVMEVMVRTRKELESL